MIFVIRGTEVCQNYTEAKGSLQKKKPEIYWSFTNAGYDVVPVARLEGFRALKSSSLEAFRALKPYYQIGGF